MQYDNKTSSHHSTSTPRIKMPAPPSAVIQDDPFSLDIYNHFTCHIHNSSTHMMELRIFEAIQSTAVHMDISNAFAATTLVDLGLRAPRKAFPASFLDFVDKIRTNKELRHNARPSLMALNEHWHYLRENFIFYTMASSAT